MGIETDGRAIIIIIFIFIIIIIIFIFIFVSSHLGSKLFCYGFQRYEQAVRKVS